MRAALGQLPSQEKLVASLVANKQQQQISNCRFFCKMVDHMQIAQFSDFYTSRAYFCASQPKPSETAQPIWVFFRGIACSASHNRHVRTAKSDPTPSSIATGMQTCRFHPDTQIRWNDMCMICRVFKLFVDAPQPCVPLLNHIPCVPFCFFLVIAMTWAAWRGRIFVFFKGDWHRGKTGVVSHPVRPFPSG